MPPYVSDYSRYLPSTTPSRPAFWFTYLGTVLGAVPVMILGALLVTVVGEGTVESLVSLLPGPFKVFVLIMLFLGAIDAAVINLYGPSLTVLTIFQTFKPDWIPPGTGQECRRRRRGDSRDCGGRVCRIELPRLLLRVHSLPVDAPDPLERHQSRRLLRHQEGRLRPPRRSSTAPVATASSTFRPSSRTSSHSSWSCRSV